MFGKKKNIIRVQHYEGVQVFSQDYPCTLEVKEDQIEIKRLKPETTVTLPLDRVITVDTMEEKQFMGKYHGSPVSTAKSGKKHFLVITYQAQDGSEKYVAVWAAGSDAVKLQDVKFDFQSRTGSIVL